MVNILILGNGAREQAIRHCLDKLNTIFHLHTDNYPEILSICKTNHIELIIPSTETYLCNGIVDFFQSEPTFLVFGPTKYQAQIERSKYFSKNLMNTLSIPTAPFQYITHIDQLQQYINLYPNCVLKYSGLAQGKGVFLPPSHSEIQTDANTILQLGSDGVLIEERLYGLEVSVLAFCNGKEAILMPQAQDYKRIYDNDIGPNTGGMGAICPANILNQDELNEVKQHMDAVVQHLQYKGILYAGLIKTKNGIFFLEFNCRFGDPEAQVILNLLDSNLLDTLFACIHGNPIPISWKNDLFSAAVVLSHIDYPISKSKYPLPITIIKPIDSSITIFESNIQKESTTGGRVLTMTSTESTLQKALENIYNNIWKISYEGAYYRRDIGCNNPTNYSMNISIAILASGNGTCIEYLIKEKRDYIKIIISNKKNAPVFAKAAQHNIPYMYLPIQDSMSYETMVNILQSFHIDLLILAGYMKIVPPILFESFDTINIHPSLLPKYKGLMDLSIHQAVIDNKDLFSGCTLHTVTKDIDEGRILMQKQYKLSNNETNDSLKQQIQGLEKQCIVDYIRQYSNKKIDYSVNVEEGNNFVNSLKNNISGLGGFCAKYNLHGKELAATTDGCGTKLDLANRLNILDTIGIDLVAMNINDLLAGGAKPLFFMDYISIDKMDQEKCSKIMTGIIAGCKQANCSLIGGETAEMSNLYFKNKFDLAGFAVGEIIFKTPQQNRMNNQCILYGIQSSGIHSNGYSLIQKLLDSGITGPTSLELLEPTKIYNEIIDLWTVIPDNILGIAHITGGGFHDNLIRILPEHLYFTLNNWRFPPLFQWIQTYSKLSRNEMLSIFNCGYGMVIISNHKLSNIPYLHEIGHLMDKPTHQN